MADVRVITDEEQEKVAGILRHYANLVADKSNFNQQCEDVAALVMPSMRGTFMTDMALPQGAKNTDQQVDATGMMALSRFAAICDSLITPRNQIYQQLQADDPYVMKDRATKLWFEEVTDILFRERYKPAANFAAQNYSTYQSLGAFGNGGLFIDDLVSLDGSVGLRYRSMSMGGLYLIENHQGQVIGFIRSFTQTARQTMDRWPQSFPEIMRPALDKNLSDRFQFLHRVQPQAHDPYYLDVRGMPYSSCYISVPGKCVMQEGGYRSFPMPVSRYEQAPGETYARGPAMLVLPALKTLNAQKKVFLKQGHRAADPVLLTGDDGIVDFSMRPGALNKGGVNSQGQPMVHILPSGDIKITEEMMGVEAGTVNDAFLVSLFQILVDNGTMTATEVIERTNEKGILIAPTMSRQNEYLSDIVERELDLLGRQGRLPPMPPRLREAKGAYAVIPTSPLARMARAQEVSGYLRTVETATNIAGVTQDPAIMDNFDFDTSLPEIAEINAAPTRWMSSAERRAGIRQARAKVQATQTQIQAAPAQAAMMKAEAAAGKAK